MSLTSAGSSCLLTPTDYFLPNFSGKHLLSVMGLLPSVFTSEGFQDMLKVGEWEWGEAFIN